jgi:hypothetical protein
LQNNRVSVIGHVVALLACIIVTFAIFYLKNDPRLPYADEFAYLGYGYGLSEYDVFGKVVQPDAKPENDMFFPPVYPYFLSILMDLDQTFLETVKCALGNREAAATGAQKAVGCEAEYGIALPVQVFMASLTLFFVWLGSLRLSSSVKISTFAVVLALLSKQTYGYADHFLTEALTLPFAAALGWSLVAAWQDKTVRSAIICGFCWALIVLTRAGWEYTGLVIVPVFVWLALLTFRDKALAAFSPLVVMLVAFGVTLSPWLVRNYVVFNQAQLTGGYGNMALLHRLPYNRMTADEYRAAFIYWLPDFGDGLAAKLFPKEHYERLDFGSKNGFYQAVRSEVTREIDEKRGQLDRNTYVMKHEVIGNLGTHVSVTMAMVWRGMWVGKYWGLVAWILCIPLFIYALFKRWGALIVLALPPVFMMGLSAFVSVSIPRYNLTLIPVLAFGSSYVLACAADLVKKKFKQRKF